MSVSAAGLAGSLVLDAEALYRELLRGVRSLMGPNTQLVGRLTGSSMMRSTSPKGVSRSRQLPSQRAFQM